MIRTKYLAVGDSLTEEFNGSWDGTNMTTVSCRGLGGKLGGECWRNDMANAVPMGHNFGMSGFEVKEYLDRSRGLILADPTEYTAVIFSAWSPNVPAGETAPYATSDAVLAANRAEILAYVDFLLALSLIPIPRFIYASPFLLGTPEAVRLKNEMDWMRTHFSVDGTVETSYMLFAGGISRTNGGTAQDAYWPAEYRGDYVSDATHLNTAGYTAEYNYCVAQLPTVTANSILANGFVEA